MTLTFNSPYMIEDVSLHPCVARDRWERERLLAFIPPDGKFELLSYHITRTNQLPIYVTPSISFSSSGSTTNEADGPVSICQLNVVVGSRSTDGKVMDEVRLIPLLCAMGLSQGSCTLLLTRPCHR